MDWFKKQDPYIIATIGKQSQRSKTCSSGGKSPSWTDTLTFKLTGRESLLDLVIFDEDFFSKDDYIAEAHVDIAELVGRGSGMQTLEVKRKGKDCGSLNISFEFLPVSQPVGYVHSGTYNYPNQFEQPSRYTNTQPQFNPAYTPQFNPAYTPQFNPAYTPQFNPTYTPEPSPPLLPNFYAALHSMATAGVRDLTPPPPPSYMGQFGQGR